MRPSLKKILFGSVYPYGGALLALDFVGARSNGTPYYMLNGTTYTSVSAVPGWTYTGGTPAGVGSYAAKANGSLQFFPSYTNLVLRSQTFDNATWGKAGTTVSADATTAPDGTLTADKIAEDASTGAHQVFQGVTVPSSATYTYSVYLKAGERSYAALYDGTAGKGKYFDLSTGSVLGNLIAAPDSATITSAGSGWYRCTITVTTAGTTFTPAVYLSANGTTFSYAGSAGSGVYIWGAQLELGSTASTYIPTTSAAVTVGTPRITDAGYLAEEARTNSIRNNSMTGAVVGTPGTAPTNWTITANGNGLSSQVVATGTDSVTGASYIEVRFSGTTTSATAMQIKFEAGTGIAATNAQAWTLSAYAAVVAGSVSGFSLGPYLQFDMNNSGGGYVGNSSNVAMPTTSTMSRTSLTFTTNQATTAYVVPYIFVTPGSGKVVDFTLRVSLPQMELGSFATSPIPTTSVAVTRSADVGYVSGLVVPSAYTLLASGTVPAADTVTNKIIATLGVGADSNNRASIIRFATATMSPLIYNAGSGSGPSGYAVTPGNRVGAALAFGSGSASFTLDGNAALSAASTAPSGSIDRLTVGARNDNSIFYNAPIQRIVIYPRAMGAAELQAITTAGAY